MKIRKLFGATIAAGLFAIAGAAATTSAHAQAITVEAFCPSAFVHAAGYSNPLPYSLIWGQSGAFSYTEFCPTSTSTGYAACGTHCLSSGWGSITVEVRDANNVYLGTGVYNGQCAGFQMTWPGCF